MPRTLPHTDLPALLEWIAEAESAEDLAPLLGLGVPRLTEATYRHAPPAVITEEFIRPLLATQHPGQPAKRELLALCRNRQLPAEARQALLGWIQAALLRIEEYTLRSEAIPSHVAPSGMLRALEEAGHPLPAGFLEPLRDSLHTPPSGGGRSARAFYAELLLERWYDITPKDVLPLYQALGQTAHISQLLRHPAARQLEFYRAVVDRHGSFADLVAELLDIEEARRDPYIRERIVERAWPPSCLKLLPLATEDEYVRMVEVCSIKSFARLKEIFNAAAPSAGAFRRIFRILAREDARAALRLLEEYGREPFARGIAAEDFLPLLQSEEPDLRLQAQTFWAENQQNTPPRPNSEQRAGEETAAPGARSR